MVIYMPDENGKAGNENNANGNERMETTNLTELMKDKNILNTEIYIDGLYEGKFGEFLVLQIFGKRLIINEKSINYLELLRFYNKGNSHLVIKIEKKMSKNNRVYYKITILKVMED